MREEIDLCDVEFSVGIGVEAFEDGRVGPIAELVPDVAVCDDEPSVLVRMWQEHDVDGPLIRGWSFPWGCRSDAGRGEEEGHSGYAGMSYCGCLTHCDNPGCARRLMSLLTAGR